MEKLKRGGRKMFRPINLTDCARVNADICWWCDEPQDNCAKCDGFLDTCMYTDD